MTIIMIMISKLKCSTFLCAALSFLFFSCSSAKSDKSSFLRFSPLRGQIGFVPPSVDTHKNNEGGDSHWPIPKGTVFSADDINESDDPDVQKLKSLHYYLNGQLVDNRFLYSSVLTNEKHLDELLILDSDDSPECDSQNSRSDS